MTRCFHIALFCVVAIVWCQGGMLLNYSITRNSAGGCCLFHTQRQVIIPTNRKVSTFLSFTFAFVSFHVLGQLKHNENHLRHLCTYLELCYTFLSTFKCSILHLANDKETNSISSRGLTENRCQSSKTGKIQSFAHTIKIK